MASKRQASAVWNYFSHGEEFATCLVPGYNAKVKHSKNTSNLLKHLKCRHLQQHQECLEERRLMNENNAKKSRPQQISQQPTIEQTINSTTLFSNESTKRKRMDDALVEMITTDMQPPSIVEDRGFVKFIKVTEPRYQLPSRRTIMRKLLPDKYSTLKDEVMKKNSISHLPGLDN